jgi:hypothetical protein
MFYTVHKPTRILTELNQKPHLGDALPLEGNIDREYAISITSTGTKHICISVPMFQNRK